MKNHAIAHTHQQDAEYDQWVNRMNARFMAVTGNGASPVFTTDSDGMWEAYLGSFPDAGQRQYHNCSACRHFINRFGGLVTVDNDGLTKSAIWDSTEAPEEYKPAVAAFEKMTRKAKITGVFLSSDAMWGTPVTGEWHHYAIAPPKEMIYKKSLLTANQAMAEKREDYKNVSRALAEFTPAIVDQALTLLQTDSLYRSEKVIGPVKWLSDLHAVIASGKNKQNIVWRAIATAPAGFCHPRSSMAGTLLDDIASGMSFDTVSRRFKDKMHPLQYQRPQAAPTSGAIAAAEKIVAELGAAGSLARRFARLDEVQAIWRPAAAKAAQVEGGVFGHLKAKDQTEVPNITIPAQTMTWDKFQRTVLPTADRIEILAPPHGNYTALVTAVNADAPPILQWDREDARNPVSWYLWHGGTSASSFGLTGNKFHDVEAITLKPSMWNGGNEHQGIGVVFIISGAKETKQSGAAIFPEILRSEFHGIRAVIESYSRSAKIEGMDQPHAAGIMLGKGEGWNACLRVWSNGKPLEYKLDRWD